MTEAQWARVGEVIHDQNRLERRVKNLEAAFVGVSFLFVVYMLCDIFGGI